MVGVSRSYCCCCCCWSNMVADFRGSWLGSQVVEWTKDSMLGFDVVKGLEYIGWMITYRVHDRFGHDLGLGDCECRWFGWKVVCYFMVWSVGCETCVERFH
ncbi:hypothetical protein HanRHA438_Chr08g0348001 [Helianthus annuus]|nr:hypothetical protein HanRHA438_Chr08g0348001 [Helianthus annuus]